MVSTVLGLSGRVYRFILQSAARELLSTQRVAECLRRTTGAVNVVYSPESEQANYRNLQVCGSVWHCPVCSARIAEQRRVDLYTGLTYGSVQVHPLMVTLTVQHDSQMVLRELLSAFLKAHGKLLAGAPFKRFKAKYGWIGYCRALEVTHGFNGWHPHSHSLVLLDHKLSDYELEQFDTWLTERWITALEKFGFTASDEYGLHVVRGENTLAEYVAKWSQLPKKWVLEDEITRGYRKKARDGAGRNPIELLHDFAFFDDKAAGDLFVEYALTFKGRNQLTTSKGFWDLLGIEEQTDEEIAEAVSEDSHVLMILDFKVWKQILKSELRGQLLDYIESVKGDFDSVIGWLKAHGITETNG